MRVRLEAGGIASSICRTEPKEENEEN